VSNKIQIKFPAARYDEYTSFSPLADLSIILQNIGNMTASL